MTTKNKPLRGAEQLSELSPWLKFLIALGVAAIVYFFIGAGGFLASLLGGIGHTLPLLLETLWYIWLRWLQQRRKQNPLTPPQVRALILCGVVLAVGIGVPIGHKLTPATPRHSNASIK